MENPEGPKWKTRLVRGEFPGRDFDMEFWQEQGDEAIFRAAWEMVELAQELKHGVTPALQTSVTSLKQIPGRFHPARGVAWPIR